MWVLQGLPAGARCALASGAGLWPASPCIRLAAPVCGWHDTPIFWLCFVIFGVCCAGLCEIVADLGRGCVPRDEGIWPSKAILCVLCGADFQIAIVETRWLFPISGEHGLRRDRTLKSRKLFRNWANFVMFRVTGGPGSPAVGSCRRPDVAGRVMACEAAASFARGTVPLGNDFTLSM